MTLYSGLGEEQDAQNFFKKKIGRYFSKRGTYLVGIELPIINAPNKMLNNILFMGMIDIILYNENSDTFDIIDIKTSTRGWHDKMKKNEAHDCITKMSSNKK